VIYEPSPWGRRYHACAARETLGGGSAGGGKSIVLLHDPDEQIAVQHARCEAGEFRWGQAPGAAIHFRREFPRLRETIHRSKMWFPRMDPGAKWDENDKIWTLSSGYRFMFGHLKDRDTFLNYQSAEFTHMAVDEVTEIEDADAWHYLCSRVRTDDRVLSKMLKRRAMSNPYPNWVRDYFVEPCRDGNTIIRKKIILEDGSEEWHTRIFLPALLKDNPNAAFRRQYEVELRAKPRHIRAALLNGDWYVVAGSFYADLWDPDIVVIDPFPIPRGWRRFRSGDWGYRKECAIHWWAVSPDGELICYRERTFNGEKARRRLDASQVAKEIKDIELAAGEWNRVNDCSALTGPMDNQLWEERGHRGRTMADDMAMEGVYWKKATKGRRMAAAQMIKRLSQRGYNGRPGIMFFRTCVMATSTIPALGVDDEEPEAPKKGGPDHWHDSASYACVYSPLPSGMDDALGPVAGDFDDFEEPDVQPDRGQFGYGLH